MPSLILLMIAGAAVFAFWNASRAAAERAEVLGRNACKAADVQWLDQSVHGTGLRLVLLGDQLIAFTGPSVASVSSLQEARAQRE